MVHTFLTSLTSYHSPPAQYAHCMDFISVPWIYQVLFSLRIFAHSFSLSGTLFFHKHLCRAPSHVLKMILNSYGHFLRKTFFNHLIWDSSTPLLSYHSCMLVSLNSNHDDLLSICLFIVCFLQLSHNSSRDHISLIHCTQCLVNICWGNDEGLKGDMLDR